MRGILFIPFLMKGKNSEGYALFPKVTRGKDSEGYIVPFLIKE